MASWALPITQELAGIIAGTSRQAAQQGARHGYIKWLRALYRREVIEGAARYPGTTVQARHKAYVGAVSARLALVRVEPTGKRGRPVQAALWAPGALARVLGVEAGGTLVDVFNRWAEAEFKRFTNLVQRTITRAKALGKPIKASIRQIVDTIYPPWARPGVVARGWGRHLYGSGYRAAHAPS